MSFGPKNALEEVKKMLREIFFYSSITIFNIAQNMCRYSIKGKKITTKVSKVIKGVRNQEMRQLRVLKS